MENLPAQIQHRLFVKNMAKYENLLLLTRFSFETTLSEWEFFLAKEDLKYYTESFERVKKEDCLYIIPFSTSNIMNLIRLIKSCTQPILMDHSVFMLVMLIVLFDDPQDSEVTSIREQYWTMLRRSLVKRNICRVEDVQSCMESLRYLVDVQIPLLTDTFAEAYRSIGINMGPGPLFVVCAWA